MKTVAVTQSNYIPWKGYFDMIRACDHVVFLEDVQYTRRDWRNRNKIKTTQGPKWLSVPVNTKSKYADLRICDVEVSEPDWAAKHWNMITQNYKKSPCFDEISHFLAPTYEKAADLPLLSSINRLFIEEICKYLGINTKFSVSTDHFNLEALDALDPTQRLLDICLKTEATRYISGPAAKDYMNTDLFKQKNIDVQWADYSGYKEYDQPYGEFSHAVSIIDLLMIEGKNSLHFMKELKQE